MMLERRQRVRQRSLLGARIEFNRTQTHDCVIRNYSAKGARLECSASVLVPKHFNLFIHAYRERRPVRLMWRNESAIGVSFSADDERHSTGKARP